MYAQPYVGARVAEFNVSQHVFAASIGADLPHRYNSGSHVLKT